MKGAIKMGRFVNPENSAFQVALNSEIYVDKTGLIKYTNKVLNTKQAFICNSRPRRFGKSMTADMLTAYYSRGCDSEKMFEGLTISRDSEFRKHLNRYDGYRLMGRHVYNPKAVVSVMLRGEFQSYWSDTGTYESIRPLINMDFDGLKTEILAMLSGGSVKVRVRSFQNDMVTFRNKDDVLTLLIHLGYLGYDQKDQTAFIPNEEIRSEFAETVEEDKWNEFTAFQRESEALLDATLDMDEEAVAKGMEKIHMEYASAIQYNDENSLSSVLTIAYLSAMQYYFKPIREMPAGRGFADFVFLPKPEYTGEYPALVAELKWNKNANAAISQILEKKYPSSLEQYTGEILLVGINYDKKTKEHECAIKKYIV